MKKMIRLCRAFMRQMNSKHVGAYAASAAFFMFLSLIPILLLLCSIIPYTPVSEADLMYLLQGILPEALVPMAVSIVSEMYAKSAGVLSVTVVVTVWSAAKGLLAISRGLNVINEVKETRNYFLLRIKASVYTVIFLLAIILSLIVMVFGQVIVNNIVENFSQHSYLMEIIMSVREIFIILILTLFFTIILSVLPNGRVPWKTQIPGALLISLFWLVFSWLFSIYVNQFSGFGMYGSLSTVIMIMLWLYICMYIVMFGALLNRFLLPANKFLQEKLKLRKVRRNNQETE